MDKFTQSSSINVLLIESPDRAASVSHALNRETSHYNLTVFHTLSESRKYLSETLPDLVIADLKLPDGNGIELLTGSHKPLPCPLILLAEESSRLEAYEATRKGASDYILKDVTPAYEIPRIIERVLKQKNFSLEYKNTQQALMESEERAKSTYDLIRHIMKGTSSKRRKEFLKSLAQDLALALKLPFAGIGKLNYPDEKSVGILAFWNGKEFGEEFTYELADTPCKIAFQKEWCIYPENAAELFPKDQMLVDAGVEGYMGVILFDESDKPIGIIWVMDTKSFKDVQSMKEIMTIFAARAEMELQILLMEKAHLITESMAQSIVDNVVDGIITIDDKGIIESFNNAAEKMFGYSVNEIIGKNINMLMPEPYRSQHDDGYIGQYIKTGAKKMVGAVREVQSLRKDGSTFQIEMAVSEIIVGEKRLFTGVIRDITECKKSEQELIQAKLEAEKVSRAKTEFLSRMSHELRTPLNSIMGFSQLLEMAAAREKYPENHINYIEQVLRAGSHLLELINEVLDLTRVESGKIETHPEPVDLKNLLNEMVALMQPIAQKSKVHISNETDFTGCSMIKADKGLLKQCILNLLSNAVKYNQEKGEVNLHCRMAGNRNIQICVTDTGPGLSKKQQASLFQPFERLGAENSEIEGSGIGLTITKKIVELMDGTIGYESQLGKGSTFFIELPVYEESYSEPVKAVPRAMKTLQGKNTFKIFYIEDNQANLALIEHTLSRFSNIQLISAFNGRQGLQKIQEHMPDLILLDMGLPDMEGLDVLKELKKNQETKDIPIVVLSANALQSHINQSKDLGIEQYLIKPIDIKEFADVINQYTN